MPFQNRIEIMAPAGSFESLAAALQGGADSRVVGGWKLEKRCPPPGKFLGKVKKKTLVWKKRFNSE